MSNTVLRLTSSLRRPRAVNDMPFGAGVALGRKRRRKSHGIAISSLEHALRLNNLRAPTCGAWDKCFMFTVVTKIPKNTLQVRRTL